MGTPKTLLHKTNGRNCSSQLRHAEPEIGIASTKAFTSQLTALFLLALKLGQLRGKLDTKQSIELIEQLSRVPLKIKEVLHTSSAQCEQLARELSTARDFLYLGRGIHFPIALEGALKLKEISYIHADGYPAGEMKHGPNALIDSQLLYSQHTMNRTPHRSCATRKRSRTFMK